MPRASCRVPRHPVAGSMPARAPRSPEPHLRELRVEPTGLGSKRVRSYSALRFRGESVECVPVKVHARSSRTRSLVPVPRLTSVRRGVARARCTHEVCTGVLGCPSMLPTRRISITRASCPSRSRRTLARPTIAAGRLRTSRCHLASADRPAFARGHCRPRPAARSSLGSSVAARSAPKSVREAETASPAHPVKGPPLP